MDTATFDGLAYLLEYPREVYRSRAAALAADVASLDADVAARLQPFFAAVDEASASDLEELYTRTFDINPVCSQEVGWQVYGETYDRGGFLVKINALLREHEVEPTVELGDHLPQMLRLFARTNPKKSRELAIGFLDPALEKMLDGFSDRDNPYYHLMRAVQRAVAVRVAEIEAEECHVR